MSARPAVPKGARTAGEAEAAPVTTTTPPGQAWTDIVRRSTPEHFAEAFTPDVVLEASVRNIAITGPAAVHAFFVATRDMYEQIAFTHETASAQKTVLEWDARAFGEPVSGVTVLTRNKAGAICAITLHHRPLHMVQRCADYLASVLDAPT